MQVKVYSTPTCPYCHMLKAWLKQKNVSFQDVDVSKDQKAAMEMVSKSGQMGVPQTLVNGKMVVGFDPETIERELKISGAGKAKA